MDKLLEHLRTFLIAVVSAGVLYGVFFLIFGPDKRLPNQKPIYSGPAETATDTKTAVAAEDAAAEVLNIQSSNADPVYSEIETALDDSEHLAPQVIEEPITEQIAEQAAEPVEETEEESSLFLNVALSTEGPAKPIDELEWMNEDQTEEADPVLEYSISLPVLTENAESAENTELTQTAETTEIAEAAKVEEEPVDFFDRALHEAAVDEMEMAAVKPKVSNPVIAEPATSEQSISEQAVTERSASKPIIAQPVTDQSAVAELEAPKPVNPTIAEAVTSPVLEEAPANSVADNSINNINIDNNSESSVKEDSMADLTIPMLEVKQVNPPQAAIDNNINNSLTEVVLEETEPIIENTIPAELAAAAPAETPAADTLLVEAAPAVLPETEPIQTAADLLEIAEAPALSNDTIPAADQPDQTAAIENDIDNNIYNDLNTETIAETTQEAANNLDFTFAPVSLSSEKSVDLPEGTEAMESIAETISSETIPAETDLPELSETAPMTESFADITDQDNEVWFLDSGAARGHFDQIRFWRLAGQNFIPTDSQQFTVKHSVPTATVVLIHGNLSDTEATVRYGMTVKCRLDQIQAQSQTPVRYRLVIWKWPSEKILRGIRSDSQYKAQMAEQNGYSLAALLASLPQDEPVTLIGFSFGVRTIGSGLSILNSTEYNTSRYNLLFLGAAADTGSFTSYGKYAGSIPLVNQMVNVFNPNDKVLKFYPLLYKGCRTPAIGIAPIPAPNQDFVQRAISINSSIYGPEHRFAHYFAAIPNPQLESLVFSSAN